MSRGKYNLDMALKQIGGFSRYQYVATLALMVARNSGTYIYYPFAYLVMPQKFVC